jgi:hypothetical protein
MMADIAKAKRNVARMIDGGASEREIDSYLASEGLNAAQLRGAKPNYAPPKREMNVFEAVPVMAAAGGTFGQRPKILALGSALKAIPDAIEQRSLAPIGEGYRQGFDFFVDEQDRAREKLGLAGVVVEGAAGIGSGAAITKAGGQLLNRVAPKVVPTVRAALTKQAGPTSAKVLRSAGRLGAAMGGGAVAGGIYGSGEGSGVEGALYGAGGAGAVKGVFKAGEGIGVVGKRLINRYGPNIIPADQTAARMFMDKINEFGEARVVAEFEKLRAAGIRNPTLAEVIPGIARRVGSVARNDMDGARVLAAQRAGGMVGDVPILASQAAKGLSRRGGTVATRQAQMTTRKRAIQDKMMEGIQGQTAEITPAAAGALRTANLSRPMQSAENNLRTTAAARSNPVLNTEADLLRALREGEQSSGGAVAPRFDPRQTQEFADQMGWADLASQRPPVPNRLPLIEAIKRMGGIKDTYVRDGLSNWRPRARGDVEGVLGRYNAIPGLINNRTGLDPADMAERLRDAGYLGTGRIRRDGATAMTEGVQGGTVDDIVGLLENYRQDPDLYRFGLDEKYMDDFTTWAERQSQLDQGGLLGKANEVRSRVGENAYNNAGSPTSDDFLFDGVPSFGDEGIPRQFNLGTVEALRRQISGAEKAALEKADQQDLAASLGLTRRELTDPVRRQFPEYDNTLKVGEAFGKERDAMKLATGSGNQAGMAWNNVIPTEDVSNALAKMSARELRGYRQGAAQSLASKFNDGRINMSLLESLGGRGLTQERVAAQFPVNRMQDLADTSNALVNRMEAARAINPNFGSQTASNLSSDAMSSAEGFASLPMTKAGLLQRAITWISENAGGLTPAERVAVVDLGTKRMTGEIADELLRIAQTAQRRQASSGQVLSPRNALMSPGLIGTIGGVGIGGQINAAGTNQGYPQ